ncbi:MAG: dimethylarginine dimethylaminohydrolase family protein [Planctomycetota bacterium]
MGREMLYESAEELRRFDARPCRRRARPRGVLVCPPDHFDVTEVRNVHMEGMLGTVDHDAARAEWEALVRGMEALGLEVARLEPAPDLADMVFTCNPSLGGVDREGRPFAILSRMRHPGRAREVERHRRWLRARGVRIVEIPAEAEGVWEGGGDAIWHPGRYFLWGGHGQRSDRQPYAALSRTLELPVALLRLDDPEFYHLDTCLAMLDERSAAWVPAAFTEEGRGLIAVGFERLIEVDETEARERFAANLYSPDGARVLLPAGAPKTRARLERAGFEVHELATDEYLKSGGSIYCMRQEIF